MNGDTNRSYQEVNGTPVPGLGKRKKSRRRKRCEYLQDWVDKSSSFQQQPPPYPVEEPPPGYWPQQRMFAAVSDPSVGRYSVPLGFSLEPISLPLYPVFQPVLPTCRPHTHRAVPRHKSCAGGVLGPAKGAHPRAAPPSPLAAMQTLTLPGGVNCEEFTSLPPQTQPQLSCDEGQRRFSDPGLVPPPHEDTSDTHSSDESSRVTATLVVSLLEQVNGLQESNRQLFKELHATRVELETLKTQAASTWKQPFPDYNPGVLSDLVREVRDAAKVREDALLARVCSMIKAADLSKMDWVDTLTLYSVVQEKGNTTPAGLNVGGNNNGSGVTLNICTWRQSSEVSSQVKLGVRTIKGYNNMEQYHKGESALQNMACYQCSVCLALIEHVQVFATDGGADSAGNRFESQQQASALHNSEGDCTSTQKAMLNDNTGKQCLLALTRATAATFELISAPIIYHSTILVSLVFKVNLQRFLSATDNVEGVQEEEILSQQLLHVEKEKLELRRELQEAVDSKKETEAQALKLERLVGILRKKINGLSVEEPRVGIDTVSPDQSPGSSLETSESVSSSTFSGKSHSPSPLVTISGPVTEL
uniref:Uncharacterized protein n=1 Tax=Timema cristinae TaxID=61476 RepID=A0A7R9H4H9_TIMCR|nr:unnamed protein product [Timema cristinae]